MKRCPRCKMDTMEDDDVLNALSHDGKTYICSTCGRIESLERFRPDLAEGLKIAQRRAQAAIFGIDEKGNPKLPK